MKAETWFYVGAEKISGDYQKYSGFYRYFKSKKNCIRFARIMLKDKANVYITISRIRTIKTSKLIVDTGNPEVYVVRKGKICTIFAQIANARSELKIIELD
jgi:hypothetical protein